MCVRVHRHMHTHTHHPNAWLKTTQQMLLIWTLLKHLIKMSHEILLAKQVQIGWKRRIPMQFEHWPPNRKPKVMELINKWQQI